MKMKIQRVRIAQRITRKTIADEQRITSIGLPLSHHNVPVVKVFAKTNNQTKSEELEISFSKKELLELLTKFEEKGL